MHMCNRLAVVLFLPLTITALSFGCALDLVASSICGVMDVRSDAGGMIRTFLARRANGVTMLLNGKILSPRVGMPMQGLAGFEPKVCAWSAAISSSGLSATSEGGLVSCVRSAVLVSVSEVIVSTHATSLEVQAV